EAAEEERRVGRDDELELREEGLERLDEGELPARVEVGAELVDEDDALHLLGTEVRKLRVPHQLADDGGAPRDRRLVAVREPGRREAYGLRRCDLKVEAVALDELAGRVDTAAALEVEPPDPGEERLTGAQDPTQEHGEEGGLVRTKDVREVRAEDLSLAEEALHPGEEHVSALGLEGQGQGATHSIGGAEPE